MSVVVGGAAVVLVVMVVNLVVVVTLRLEHAGDGREATHVTCHVNVALLHVHLQRHVTNTGTHNGSR